MVKEFLDERAVDYELRRVAVDPASRREFLQSGWRLPPVVVVDGVAVEVPAEGFDIEALEALLGL